ncbi:3-oxoacyl-[acyl-carrier-protein] synthase II [Burkholderiales bacterium]|nr:3-oxoacyl-[acyl-carrier-protein] synthase II [Burkholderiales bacterium]
MAKRRVVITGLGIICPVGLDLKESWEAIIAGKSGITRITRFDASNCASQIAGEVKGFDPAKYLPPKEARRYDTFVHYGVAAAIEAIADAGLDLQKENLEQIGVCIGSGIGGLPLSEDTHNALKAGGTRKVSPFFIPGSIVNMVSGCLSIMYGLKGPNLSIVTACATATHSIGEAARLIEYGDAEVMVAGGTEATVCELAIAGFSAARALSTRNDDPATASRPWDQDRDGFVLGEGAGVLVLEEYERAKARGARIYAELAGYGMSADANHITAPCEDGEGAARCIRNTLRNGGLDAGEIDYINAHGTSTPLGDLAETIAVKRALGEQAHKLVMSSTKSAVGHLLGGAGGVEAVFTTLAVFTQTAPPTINLFNQDPQCDLDYAANAARSMNIRVALSNSFGFGGTNATLAFRRV